MSKFQRRDFDTACATCGDPGKIRTSDLRFRKPFTSLMQAMAQRRIGGIKSYYINRYKNHSPCTRLHEYALKDRTKYHQKYHQEINSDLRFSCPRSQGRSTSTRKTNYVYPLPIGLELAGSHAAG